ncbi:MAG: hypothetical protein GDA50_07720, partial [Alphaproteobacteria bacterium GM202ARS2]|nr:hypothetical protein [Alphaproteobacteria bacterium GM202ARS2]
KVGGDCTGAQGFEDGKCIAATTAKHCTDRGTFVLNKVGGGGCQMSGACETDGYKIVAGECVAQVAGECTGVQGFAPSGGGGKGRCIAATTAKHCTDRGALVLNKVGGGGCQTSDDCTGAGYKVESNTCVAQGATDCTGAQGFAPSGGKGKCIAATTVKHCTDRGAFVLNKVGGGGCQMSGVCETSGYKVVSDECVAKVAGDCTGTQGFQAGKCVADPRDATHCQAVGKVLRIITIGCESAKACTDAGYKVVDHACAFYVPGECGGTLGFSNGRCVVSPRHPIFCQQVGRVLQFDGVGCEPEKACTDSGYKVKSHACVAKVAGDCKGAEEGFAAGKCVALPTDATHCLAVGKVLQFDTIGCEAEKACTDDGYKVESNTCVVQVAGDCKNAQGFESGKCIAPTTAKHCTDRGSYVFNKVGGGGCQTSDDCSGAGYKVVGDECVAKVAGDCTGAEEGFDPDDGGGRCVAQPSKVKHCKAVGKVLQLDTEGCETIKMCKDAGYKVESNTCVVQVAGDCMDAQGFEDGKCIAATTVKHCTDRGSFLLNRVDGGCQTARACRQLGYKVVSGTCIAQGAYTCTGAQGFDNGSCIAATTVQHCTARGVFILNRVGGGGCQTSNDCTGAGYTDRGLFIFDKAGGTGCQRASACEAEGYKIEFGTCVFKVGSDCTGTQGFQAGKCVAATTVKHCTDRGSSYVLNRAGAGCQTSDDCTGAGYKVESNTCVLKVAGDCTGTQGFQAGKCVVATTAQHCTDKGAYVLNKVGGGGCQMSDACETNGYKVDAGECVAQSAGDCTGTQGFEPNDGQGKCIAHPQYATQCQAVGKVLDFDKQGCGLEKTCTTAGYVVNDGACVVAAAGSCAGEQGFDSDKDACVAKPLDVNHCQAIGKVLQFDRRGCETATACRASGRKLLGNVCVAQTTEDCKGEQGLYNGGCVDKPTEVRHCLAVGKILHTKRAGCVSRDECRQEGYAAQQAGNLDKCIEVANFFDCLPPFSTEGFVDGQCQKPTKAEDCKAHFQSIFSPQSQSCVFTGRCIQSRGYIIIGRTCVRADATHCTGTQGFAPDVGKGECIAPTTIAHCTNRGAYVMNLQFDGCELATACINAGHQIIDGTCVRSDSANSPRDCKEEQGFDNGFCINNPTESVACKRIGRLLQNDGTGCVTVGQCLGDGYKSDKSAGKCIAQTAADCVGQDFVTNHTRDLLGRYLEDRGLNDGACTRETTKPAHCQAIRQDYVLQLDGKGCMLTLRCESFGYRAEQGACLPHDGKTCHERHQGLYQGSCTLFPYQRGRKLCTGIAKRGDYSIIDARYFFAYDTVGICSAVQACADGNEAACESVKSHEQPPLCKKGMVAVYGGTCEPAADVCHSSQAAVNDMCLSAVDVCPDRSGFDVGMRLCVETTPTPLQCRALGRYFDATTNTPACIKTHECISSRGFTVARLPDPSQPLHCIKDRNTATNPPNKNDCPSGQRSDTGVCMTTPLSTPEAIDKSFDEAFAGRRIRPIPFCIMGSGATAENMAHVGNTITDNKTCHHKNLDTPQKIRPAFAELSLRSTFRRTIVNGSLVAFTSEATSVAFADNGLNNGLLDGYKIFIPTGDNGRADFLAEPGYSERTKARIHDSMDAGHTFAVGRLNDAGDGRHAESNGCGGRDNCVFANGSFTINSSAFEGTQGATAYVAASIARALTYANVDNTIETVNALFDAARVDVNGVSVFHPFRLIDKAEQLIQRQGSGYKPVETNRVFDAAFSPEVTRPTDICLVDDSSNTFDFGDLASHLQMVKSVQESLLSSQAEPCARDFNRDRTSGSNGQFLQDYYGDNVPESVKIPVGAIVNYSLATRIILWHALQNAPSGRNNVEGYKIFISTGNSGRRHTTYFDIYSPALFNYPGIGLNRGLNLPDTVEWAVEKAVHDFFNSDDIFYVAWLDRSNASIYDRRSSVCAILPQCVAIRGEFYVHVQTKGQDVFPRFPGTSATAPYVSGAIARAMLNSPADTPLDQVNDFFHGAAEWNNGIKVFNPLKLIDLVNELWKRPRLTSDVTQVSSAFDEAFDGTYTPSPRSVTACSVGGSASAQGVLTGIGGTHVDICNRTASDTDGVRAAFTSDDSNVRLPHNALVALGRTDGFATGGLTAADLSGYKVFVPTGEGTSADFLTDSLYDTDTVARIQEGLQGGNLFYVARLNDKGTGLHASSNGCGDELHCVAARGSFTVNGTAFEGTQAAATYVAAAMARAFAHAPAGTPLDYVNDLFRKATMRHGENVTPDKYDRGIQVFNPFRLIDAVRALRARPLTVADTNQVARAFDETFILRADSSPRDVTLCFMSGARTALVMRNMALEITSSASLSHVNICQRDVATPAALKMAVTDRDDMTRIPQNSVVVLVGTDGFSTGGLVRADLSDYKVFAPTGDAPEGSHGVADFLADSSLYDTDMVSRIRDALAGNNLFYVAALNEDGTGLRSTSNGCGDVANCVAARGSFNVNGASFTGTQAATVYVAASLARAVSHIIEDVFIDIEGAVNRLFNKARMEHNGLSVFNPFRLMDEVRIMSDIFSARSVRQGLSVPEARYWLQLSQLPIQKHAGRKGYTGANVLFVDDCYVGGTQVSRDIATGMSSVSRDVCVPDSPRDLVDVRNLFGRDTTVDDALRTQKRYKTLLQGDMIALAGTVGGKSIFGDGGIERADLAGYKVFVSTGDAPEGSPGVADFLRDTSIYDTQAVATVEDALEGDDLFFVARLNDEGDGWHADSNGCGAVDNCVGATSPDIRDNEGALAFVVSFLSNAMFRTPEGTPLSFVNALFNSAIDVVGDIQVFNPLKAIDLVASLYPSQTRQTQSATRSIEADTSEEKIVATSAPPQQQERSADAIYQALMRAQYASVGRAGIPTQMDAIRIDVTEFGETRAFTMPAVSYRYESLPVPSHSPLFGMLGMVYRADGRYPEVGFSLNDKEGRSFISASHYRSEDFFGAYGSGAFRFAHVENYRVVGKHEVVAGLDVTLWGRCGFVREGGVLLDWQRGCDSGAGVSYVHGFMGGELTWRAEGARFLGGSLSSSGRRYRIKGGASQGEASVQLRFQW